MFGLRRQNTNIFRRIVELIAIGMMDYLAITKWAAQCSFCDNDMFVDVTIRVCSWMLRKINAAIAVYERDTALPITTGIAFAACYARLELIFYRRVNTGFLVVFGYLASCLFRNGMPPHGFFLGSDVLLSLLAFPVLVSGYELEKFAFCVSALVVGGLDHVRRLSATAFAKLGWHSIVPYCSDLMHSLYGANVLMSRGLETA